MNCATERVHLHDRDDERDVELGPGEIFVVPRGLEHGRGSTLGAEELLIDPDGTPNTRDAGGQMTAEPVIP